MIIRSAHVGSAVAELASNFDWLTSYRRYRLPAPPSRSALRGQYNSLQAWPDPVLIGLVNRPASKQCLFWQFVASFLNVDA